MVSAPDRDKLNHLFYNEKSKRIVITTHKSPDGDAVGSSLALGRFLTLLGHDASLVLPDSMPGFLAWMPGAERFLVFDNQPEEVQVRLDQAEILFSLDYNHFSRTGSAFQKPLEKTDAIKIMIDHHQEPDTFMDFKIWDVEASSTAQLVWEFIQLLNGNDRIDQTIGTCLYVGIMTDTGSFRFKTCTAHTFRIVAKLLDKGVDGDWIHQQVYDQNSKDRIRLMGYALEKIVFLEPQRTAYIALSKNDLKRFNYQPGDTEGLVNKILSVVGVEIAALITEKEGQVRLSLRSVGDFSVNDLARAHFNGGGHKHAAGGTLKMNFNKAISYFVNTIESAIK